ncbi:uncharacterized protein [Temnothorax longispinosus]|uniref:uncharacterized protein n=1 Tax=Temnothorax longispinosus TaxID=300112 RepID=UPI003A991711
MSEHLGKQLQLQRSIERYLDNFKKIGKRNLTPAKPKSRTRALEDCAIGSSSKTASKSANSSRVHAANASANDSTPCPLCKTSHFINLCPSFISKNTSQRREIIKQHKRCFNCLSTKHSVQDCKSKYSCRVCHKRHHSLLHSDSDFCFSATGAVSSDTSDSKSEVNSLFAAAKNRSPILLATAWITVRSSSGRTAVVRALLDQGSEMTFISENLAQTLRVKRIRMPISISAVGGINAGTFQNATRIFISPRASLVPSLSTTALILPSVTSYIPKRNADISSISYLSDLPLADTDPTSRDPISLIIGADLYNEIILDGVRKGGIGQPIAQNSIFGWVISGPVSSAAFPEHSSAKVPRISTHHICSLSLEKELRRFWEIEELPQRSALTQEEKDCEEHFRSTHSRNSEGRYVVRLPFKKGPPIEIGESRVQAEKMLNSLTRRLRDKPEVMKEYHNFLDEYERLGHMRPLSPAQDNEQSVYLPHHGVIREDSVTTRLRVVFNASSVTSNGTSLNDHLHIGPKKQTDISAIIARWRRYKYVYSADIAKMYRQILVDSRDINYQRILWRRSPHDAIIIFLLLTVTYGQACVPFLALAVLEQLTIDEGKQFPLAIPILREHIYIDDAVFGADDKPHIRQIRDQLVALLKRGGFELKKWASNSPSLLDDIDVADHGLAGKKPFAQDEQLKILGIGWNPSKDVFEYRVALSDKVPDTKRTILSAVAKLYDPLGWATPVTIAAKILMQRL